MHAVSSSVQQHGLQYNVAEIRDLVLAYTVRQSGRLSVSQGHDVSTRVCIVPNDLTDETAQVVRCCLPRLFFLIAGLHLTNK